MKQATIGRQGGGEGGGIPPPGAQNPIPPPDKTLNTHNTPSINSRMPASAGIL